MAYSKDMLMDDQSVREYNGIWAVLWVTKSGSFLGQKKYYSELSARAAGIRTLKAVKDKEYTYCKPGTTEEISPDDVLFAVPMPYGVNDEAV